LICDKKNEPDWMRQWRLKAYRHWTTMKEPHWEIAEQIAFFHLNQPSSSIVVKVDFDLTLSLLAHNLYRKLTSQLVGFEKCTVPTIYRNVLENGANIKITNTDVVVRLKKKTHLPILFQLPWLQKKTHLSAPCPERKSYSRAAS